MNNEGLNDAAYNRDRLTEEKFDVRIPFAAQNRSAMIPIIIFKCLSTAETVILTCVC